MLLLQCYHNTTSYSHHYKEMLILINTLSTWSFIGAYVCYLVCLMSWELYPKHVYLVHSPDFKSFSITGFFSPLLKRQFNSLIHLTAIKMQCITFWGSPISYPFLLCEAEVRRLLVYCVCRWGKSSRSLPNDCSYSTNSGQPVPTVYFPHSKKGFYNMWLEPLLWTHATTHINLKKLVLSS